MLRVRCIDGRATTYWRAHLADHPEKRLVVKDSWQYVERDQEGELLREVTENGVPYMTRYYHHETVQVREMDDDIRSSVRRGARYNGSHEVPSRTTNASEHRRTKRIEGRPKQHFSRQEAVI